MAKKDEATAFSKLVELIEGIEIAMLTTVEPDGSLRSRPMMTQKAPFDGKLAFFTKAHSAKVDDLKTDSHVAVTYADPKQQRYVSVSGLGRLVRDKPRLAALWNPVYRAWFPEGLGDPELSLMEVSVEQAEYWDSHSSTMVHLIGLAKAVLTGKEAHPGDHQKLHFDQEGSPVH